MDKPPRLNIIFDSRRQEKYDPLVEEMTRQRISYEIWPCLMFDEIPQSINASHKMIVRDAKDRGLVEVVIAEDDVCFPNEKGWEWFLKNKPPVYDIYCAGNYLPFDKPGREGSFRVESVVGFHCYFVHSRYYDTFLNTPDKEHIDTAQKSKLMYVCYPMAAIQRSGWSANNKSVVDYNSILKKEDIYQ